MAKVLVVDDEHGIRKSLAIFLTQAGFEVHTAETVEEAVQKLQIEKIDTIVCDIVLTGASGMELMQHVHDAGLGIPVIIISGEPTIETTVRAMRLGAFDFLAKPVKGKVLCALVQDAVEKKQDRERNNCEHCKIKDCYFSLVDNLPDIVCRTDGDGIIKFVNPAAEAILGYSTQELIGFPPDRYMTQESIEGLKTYLLTAIKTEPVKTNIRTEVEYIHKDGYIVPCEINVTLVFDQENRIVSLEGVARVLSGN